MTLWKKNFLFVFTLFQSILFIGLLVFVSYSFHQDLSKEKQQFQRLILDNVSFARKAATEDLSMVSKDMVLTAFKQQQFFLKVQQDDETLLTTFETEAAPAESDKILLIKVKQEQLLIYETTMASRLGEVKVQFAKNISSVYQEQQTRMLLSVVFGLSVSGIISCLIYWQMKKIYRPIQNLSHELRTPLTLISGYSEMLMRMKTTEEEKVTMGKEIFEETAHLQEIIEQLLIMGELKEGVVAKESVDLAAIVDTLQLKYPVIRLRVVKPATVQGSRILLIQLFNNLLENAHRAGTSIEVVIDGREVQIWNDGKTIPADKLYKLNHGKQLIPSEYDGNGQGFQICRDIVALHQGKIKIASDEKRTVVTLEFFA